MSRIERRRQRQLEQLGSDAHHLPAEVGLRGVLADAARKDRVADEGVVGDDEANAAGRMARGMQNREVELPKLELVAIRQVAVSGAKELLAIGGVQRCFPAGQLLQLILPRDVARVAVRGE